MLIWERWKGKPAFLVILSDNRRFYHKREKTEQAQHREQKSTLFLFWVQSTDLLLLEYFEFSRSMI